MKWPSAAQTQRNDNWSRHGGMTVLKRQLLTHEMAIKMQYTQGQGDTAHSM
jgi:hypothetical protein